MIVRRIGSDAQLRVCKRQQSAFLSVKALTASSEAASGEPCVFVFRTLKSATYYTLGCDTPTALQNAPRPSSETPSHSAP